MIIKLFKSQLNLFDNQIDELPVGATKKFGENDTRRKEQTASGKVRWVDADKTQVDARNVRKQPENKENNTHKLSKKDVAYFEKMLPTVLRDLENGRDFSSTILSIKSGLLRSEFQAVKKWFIDKGVIDNKGEFIKRAQDKDFSSEYKKISMPKDMNEGLSNFYQMIINDLAEGDFRNAQFTIQDLISDLRSKAQPYPFVTEDMIKQTEAIEPYIEKKDVETAINFLKTLRDSSKKISDQPRVEKKPSNEAVSDKDINENINSNELNKHLEQKFNELSPDEFSNYLEEVANKVHIKQRYKNDAQSVKRANTLRDWQRENSNRINEFTNSLGKVPDQSPEASNKVKQPYEMTRDELKNKFRGEGEKEFLNNGSAMLFDDFSKDGMKEFRYPKRNWGDYSIYVDANGTKKRGSGMAFTNPFIMLRGKGLHERIPLSNGVNKSTLNKIIKLIHKNEIQQALSENKQVPIEVLNDYKGEKWADDAIEKLQAKKSFYVRWKDRTINAFRKSQLDLFGTPVTVKTPKVSTSKTSTSNTPGYQYDMFTGQERDGKKLLPSEKNPNVRRWQSTDEEQSESRGERQETKKETNEHKETFEKIKDDKIKTPTDLGESIKEDHEKKEKQPHEMTKKEFIEWGINHNKIGQTKKYSYEDIKSLLGDAHIAWETGNHKKKIQEVLQNGGEVPEEVLKDYPDLQPKKESKPEADTPENLVSKLTGVLEDHVKDFGITEVFIHEGELHITSNYDVPGYVEKQIEKKLGIGEEEEKPAEKPERETHDFKVGDKIFVNDAYRDNDEFIITSIPNEEEVTARKVNGNGTPHIFNRDKISKQPKAINSESSGFGDLERFKERLKNKGTILNIYENDEGLKQVEYKFNNDGSNTKRYATVGEDGLVFPDAKRLGFRKVEPTENQNNGIFDINRIEKIAELSRETDESFEDFSKKIWSKVDVASMSEIKRLGKVLTDNGYRNLEDLFYKQKKETPTEVDQLKAQQESSGNSLYDEHLKKVEEARKFQQMMIDVNKIVRSKITDDEKVTRIMHEHGLGLGTATKLLQPDFAGRVGFADYQLTNHRSKLKRLEQRLNELTPTKNDEEVAENGTKHIGTISSGEATGIFEGIGVKAENNFEDERVRLFFDSIPSAEARTLLKRSGFIWSPSNKAWQRKNTQNGINAVHRIMSKILGK